MICTTGEESLDSWTFHQYRRFIQNGTCSPTDTDAGPGEGVMPALDNSQMLEASELPTPIVDSGAVLNDYEDHHPIRSEGSCLLNIQIVV